MFRKSPPPAISREQALDLLDREARTYEMTHGQPVARGLISENFTEEELATFPPLVTPWFSATIDGTRRLFGYFHKGAEKDGHFAIEQRGASDKGIVIVVYSADGTPWPSKENQLLMEAPESAPCHLTLEVGMQLVAQLMRGVKW